MATTHPYRTHSVHATCEICQASAQLRCLGCSRTYCVEHATPGGYCPQCVSRLARADRVALGVSIVVFAPAALVAAGVNIYLLDVTNGAMNVARSMGVVCSLAAVLLAAVTVTPIRWIVRRIMGVKRHNGGALLEDADLSVLQPAPTAEGGSLATLKGRRLRDRVRGTAGALPEVPSYQRTCWR